MFNFYHKTIFVIQFSNKKNQSKTFQAFNIITSTRLLRKTITVLLDESINNKKYTFEI